MVSGVPSEGKVLTQPVDKIIFIECTYTFGHELNTGIQRVVRNIVRNASAAAEKYGYRAVPVIWKNDKFLPIDMDSYLSQLEKHFSLHLSARISRKQKIYNLVHPYYYKFQNVMSKAFPWAKTKRFINAPANAFGLTMCILFPWILIKKTRRILSKLFSIIDLIYKSHDNQEVDTQQSTLSQYPSHQGNILLLLDSSWGIPIWSAVKNFKAKGGKVAGVVYDLIPMTHPNTCIPSLVIDFREWLTGHIENSDVFVAISKTIRDQVKTYISQQDAKSSLKMPDKIRYFYLGSELDLVSGTSAPRQYIIDIFNRNLHTFMVVGSIEPRKNISFIVDAFELYWKAGGSGALLIVGKNYWKSEDLFKRVSGHSELNKKLYVLRDVNDVELDYAYRRASALVFASYVEGFGLPLVEAFQRGLPVLCSDIAVFREIAEERAKYFDLSNPKNLADVLHVFCQTNAVNEDSHRAMHSWITWRQSTEQLFHEVTTYI